MSMPGRAARLTGQSVVHPARHVKHFLRSEQVCKPHGIKGFRKAGRTTDVVIVGVDCSTSQRRPPVVAGVGQHGPQQATKRQARGEHGNTLELTAGPQPEGSATKRSRRAGVEHEHRAQAGRRTAGKASRDTDSEEGGHGRESEWLAYVTSRHAPPPHPHPIPSTSTRYPSRPCTTSVVAPRTTPRKTGPGLSY